VVEDAVRKLISAIIIGLLIFCLLPTLIFKLVEGKSL
jgi:hypothetical protein